MKAKLFMLVVSIGLLITSCVSQQEKEERIVEQTAKEFLQALQEKDTTKIDMLCYEVAPLFKIGELCHTTDIYHRITKISEDCYLYEYADGDKYLPDSDELIKIYFHKSSMNPQYPFTVYNTLWVVDWSKEPEIYLYPLAKKIGLLQKPDTCDFQILNTLVDVRSFFDIQKIEDSWSLYVNENSLHFERSYNTICGNFIVNNDTNYTLDPGVYDLEFLDSKNKVIYTYKVYDPQKIGPQSSILVSFVAPVSKGAYRVRVSSPIYFDVEEKILNYNRYKGDEYLKITQWGTPINLIKRRSEKDYKKNIDNCIL